MRRKKKDKVEEKVIMKVKKSKILMVCDNCGHKGAEKELKAKCPACWIDKYRVA